MNPIYIPTKRQEYFHRCNDDYIALTGSRGSGKSLCVLIEALGLMNKVMENGYWQVLIIRRTVPQLTELITRAKDLYPKIITSGKFDLSKNTFTYGKNNTNFIRFSSCERDLDVEKFRGQEYSLIIIDEGSHFDSNFVWNWLKSCNRNSHGYKNRMIITANPNNWMKKEFEVSESGEDTFKILEYYDEFSKKTVKKTRRLIQLNLESNPHISEDYRASLYQDERNRDSNLFGLWKNPEVLGQVYKDEIQKLIEDNRFCAVPFEKASDVHLFWDLGWNDYTVILFIQFIGKEIHIFKKIENRNKSLDEYVLEIKKICSEINLDLSFLNIHLPHDGSSRNLQTGLSIQEQLLKHFKNVDVLPRLSIQEGIMNTKSIFHNVYIDKNLDLLEKLKLYKRKWSDNLQDFTELEHNDIADAFRYISYYNPPKVIKFDFSNIGNSHTF
jgi:hypothetical protein